MGRSTALEQRMDFNSDEEELHRKQALMDVVTDVELRAASALAAKECLLATQVPPTSTQLMVRKDHYIRQYSALVLKLTQLQQHLAETQWTTREQSPTRVQL